MSAIVPFLLSVPLATVPLPAMLPEYDLECRAGVATSPDVTRMNISVRNVAGQRKAALRTSGVVFDAAVNTSPLAEIKSVGGKGFTEEFEYGPEERRAEAFVFVRGEIADGIVDFYVGWMMGETGIRRGTNIEGNCTVVMTDSGKGTIQ